MARHACRYIGTGFDCSGLVQYAYAQLGMSVPHSTYVLWPMVAVCRSQLQPGDLLFFNGLGHMGIYIGNNQMIHAPHTGDLDGLVFVVVHGCAPDRVGHERVRRLA